jgi:hypothetical protein
LEISDDGSFAWAAAAAGQQDIGPITDSQAEIMTQRRGFLHRV